METHSLPPAPPDFSQPNGGGKGSPLKSLPAPLRLIIRPILFAALGIHALLLFTPFPAEQKPKPPEDKKNPVKITQIQTVKPLKTVPTNAPKTDVTTPTELKVNRSTDSSVSDAPKQKPKQEQTSTTQQGPTNTQPNDQGDPFQGFPFYQPSTPNCFSKGYGEQCRIAEATLDVVKAFFDKSLPANKYEIEQPIEDAADKRIYKISKGGKSRYLHLFVDGSTVVILLSGEKLSSLEQLKGAAPNPPDAYTAALAEIPSSPNPNSNDSTSSSPAYSNFDQPQFFYVRALTPEELSGIGSIGPDGKQIPPPEPEFKASISSTKLILGKSPKDVYGQDLQLRLGSIFKSVTLVGAYGEGPLYEMKTDKHSFFLNLITAKDTGPQGGTIIVTWTENPQKQ